LSRPPPAGTVEEYPLALLVGAAAARRFTGQIRLESEGRFWTQTWRQGSVVGAESAHPEDQLGRLCVEAGLIDVPTLTECLRRMASSGRRQLDVLIQMGALAGETAQRAARLALARAATRPFQVTLANYTMEERQFEWTSDELEPRWIIYRGLRLFYDEARLSRELARLSGKAIKLRPEAEAMQDSFGFADEERILIAYLSKGYWEPGDLVDAAVSLARPVVMAVIYSLWACEALDVQVAESVPRLRKRAREVTHTMGGQQKTGNTPPQGSAFAQAPTTGSFVRPKPAAIEKPYPDAPAPAVPLAAQVGEPTTIPPAGSTPLVSFPAAATPAAATPSPKASAPAARQSSPMPAVRPPSDPPAGKSGSSLPAVKADPGPAPRASMAAMPPVTRPSADKVVSDNLREQILAKHKLIESGADYFALLDLGRDAPKEQVKTTYFQMAKSYHPDRLALVNLEELRPQVERIFARLSEAFSVLGDDARRKEYMGVLAEGGEAKVRARESQEAAKAVQILSAEEHFRRGEMALRRQAFPLALEEFNKALELNAEEGEHHAMRAWALWCVSTDKDRVLTEVKKGLLKALELNAKCAPAFYYLGTVYKHAGDIDRAYSHFQKCLDLTPGHVDAEREVRLIEMRRERGGGSPGKGGGLFDRFKKK
jgi:tetratricopeptide (TPR) repeat protein